MTADQLDFDATVDIVANDWRSDNDWRKFQTACRLVAALAGEVDPNEVRTMLTDQYGELTIEPRRLSAFYRRAAGKDGFLDFARWGINTDAKGRNQGKPSKCYRIRGAA